MKPGNQQDTYAGKPGVPLPRSFYTRSDVVALARDLLGKVLVTRIDGITTSGIICETEAYAGITDRASHAFGGRRTARTEVMYAVGGTAYVYLCYGIHSLFNVVTGAEGVPDAVLVRGILPLEGLEHMLQRRGSNQARKDFGIGPGKVSVALGIHYSISGFDLTGHATLNGSAVWMEERGIEIPAEKIVAGPRIGVAYAGADAHRPYRFWFEAW